MLPPRRLAPFCFYLPACLPLSYRLWSIEEQRGGRTIFLASFGTLPKDHHQSQLWLGHDKPGNLELPPDLSQGHKGTSPCTILCCSPMSSGRDLGCRGSSQVLNHHPYRSSTRQAGWGLAPWDTTPHHPTPPDSTHCWFLQNAWKFTKFMCISMKNSHKYMSQKKTNVPKCQKTLYSVV